MVLNCNSSKIEEKSNRNLWNSLILRLKMFGLNLFLKVSFYRLFMGYLSRNGFVYLEYSWLISCFHFNLVLVFYYTHEVVQT